MNTSDVSISMLIDNDIHNERSNDIGLQNVHMK